MTTRTEMTSLERAEADLDGDLVTFTADLMDILGMLSTELSSTQMEDLDKLARKLVRQGQDVVVARLKEKAYECRVGYENSGADQTIDADTWDNAVQAADPSEYDIFWMREWTR